ncbi:hypothetical protein I7I53_04819 [Histoplasma capsulatum var. duboisii H88]|uniref:Uncharacterized protein n=1 Tax=Ajellomyces capsulatus (strain H88) TaxID=544711 RepID=A0A8A1LXB3_AJEC8|nr:hypothetical protein I7I53_04819 [Histoplasma capsulatum var. duboisii H88]
MPICFILTTFIIYITMEISIELAYYLPTHCVFYHLHKLQHFTLFLPAVSIGPVPSALRI